MELLIVHAAATWFMVGLIWVMQAVHYPLFAAVGDDAFQDYERGHTKPIGALLVVPAMLEIITAAAIVFARPEGVSSALALLAGALLASIWLLTALVQAPQHGRLSAGFDPSTHRSLVQGNWVRTIAWSGRGILAAVMLT